MTQQQGDDIAALRAYELEARPTCMMHNFRLNKQCENPAEFIVTIPHGPTHGAPSTGFVCDDCIAATITQKYPAKCPRCRFIFKNQDDVITDRRPL